MTDASTSDMEHEVEAFLTAYWGLCSQELATYLWVVGARRKISHWAITHESTLPSTLQVATTTSAKEDVYIGCVPSTKIKSSHARTQASEAAGLIALWADIDIAGPGHEKGNLFADADEALAFVQTAWPEPSWVVHTGGGLHVWWFLDQAWIFADEQERLEGAALLRAWSAVGTSQSTRELDPVHDLARVLRVPGTFNHKLATPRPVRALLADGPRITLEQVRATVEGIVVPDGPALMDRARTEVARQQWSADEVDLQFAFDSDAALPQRWEVAVENIGPAMLDLFIRNTTRWASVSEQQMALANRLAELNFSAQEICDVLIVQRREHGEVLKEANPSYWTTTIGKALSRAATKERPVLQAVPTPTDADHATVIPIRPPAALEDIHDLSGLAPHEDSRSVATLAHDLRVPIVGVERHLADPPRLVLVFSNGKVAELGDLLTAMNMRSSAARILAACDKLPMAMSATDWSRQVETMWRIAEVVDLGAYATNLGQMRELILRRLTITRRPPEMVVEDQKSPIVEWHGRVCVRPAQFAEWAESMGLTRTGGGKLSAYDLVSRLRMLGFTREEVRLTTEEGTASVRTVWVMPLSFGDDDAPRLPVGERERDAL